LNGNESACRSCDKDVVYGRLRLEAHPEWNGAPKSKQVVDRALTDDTKSKKGAELRLKAQPASGSCASARNGCLSNVWMRWI
jgi:hypothetical protein